MYRHIAKCRVFCSLEPNISDFSAYHLHISLLCNVTQLLQVMFEAFLRAF